jgi:uncharacterized protein YbjQ (UPF0145 family)
MSTRLPPVAAERVRRQAESHVAGSLLSSPAAAALASVGLVPAGEVMGCVVMHLGWTGQSGCGYYNRYPSTTPIRVGGQYAPYMKALNQSYRTALGRMEAEARALKADGVVGVQLEWSHLDSGARELLALGTAVRFREPPLRAKGERRPAPFHTELTGEQVATAMLAGWHPVKVVAAASVAVKHEDTTTKQFTSKIRTRQNVELISLTRLVETARRDVRTRLAGQAKTLTAGQIVISVNTLELRERPCGGDRDHLAEATMIGTALDLDPGRRTPAPPPSALSILPLRDRHQRGQTF